MDLSEKAKKAEKIFCDSLEELSFDLSKYDDTMENIILSNSITKLDGLKISSKDYKAIRQIILKRIHSLKEYHNNSIEYGLIKEYNSEKGFGFITNRIARPDEQTFFHISNVTNRLKKILEDNIYEKENVYLWYSIEINNKKNNAVSAIWHEWVDIPDVERRWFKKCVKVLFNKVKSLIDKPIKQMCNETVTIFSSIGLKYFTLDQISELTNGDFRLTEIDKSGILVNLIKKRILPKKPDYKYLLDEDKELLKKDDNILNKYRDTHSVLSDSDEYFIQEIFGKNKLKDIKKTIEDNINKEKSAEEMRNNESDAHMKKQEEKRKKYEEDLIGTDITVRLDKLGRLLFGGRDGYWLSYNYVHEQIRLAKKKKK